MESMQFSAGCTQFVHCREVVLYRRFHCTSGESRGLPPLLLPMPRAATIHPTFPAVGSRVQRYVFTPGSEPWCSSTPFSLDFAQPWEAPRLHHWHANAS